MATAVSSTDSGKADYEVVSTDTSQDSMDSEVPEADPVRGKVFETVNRHVIMRLHLEVSGRVLTEGKHHVVREVQRRVSSSIEAGGYDEIGFYDGLAEFFKGNLEPLKTYPK